MDWQIPLSDIDFGPEEEEAVYKVLRSRWLTMGEVTSAFEGDFSEYHKIKHAIAVSSGTAALHLACVALGLGPGDEIILPALSFVATANAVRYTGAIPVFADIVDLNNLTISTDSIEENISSSTRAIIVMHYAGFPCDMRAIMRLAKKHGLFVIEDNAHGLGAETDGQKLGTWGDIGCFSFFSNKNLVTGEGGMVITENDEFAADIRRLRSHGMTSLTWERHSGHSSSYDVIGLGYNYRLDEIRSALGLVQLRKLDINNQKRRKHFEHYRKGFEKTGSAIQIPFEGNPGTSSAHIMPVLLPDSVDKSIFMNLMKEESIQTSMHYPPINQFKAFADMGNAEVRLPATEDAASREVTLPLYPTLEYEKVDRIIKVATEALNESALTK